MARAQTMWKEWRQERMWQPSVAPLRLQALHLIMRPRRTASSTFSRPPASLTHTCARYTQCYAIILMQCKFAGRCSHASCAHSRQIM